VIYYQGGGGHIVEESIREYSGRKFGAEDMSIIKATTEMYPKLSQKEMASTVCELIGWVTPNGGPKRLQCVEFLRKLESEGLIKLPKVREGHTRQKREATDMEHTRPIGNDAGEREISACGAIDLEIVRPGKRLAQWRGYVSSHHKLGDPRVLGSQIRYVITSECRDLGCLLFSASSWALEAREEWIGWTAAEKRARLHLIVNNSRFLILPWVRVS
jgi:hypothetical protein